MNILTPEGQYIKDIQINDSSVDVNFSPKKKVALIFISLNDRYWPYLTQVIKDCRQNFLPQHKVDYFAWTDYDYTAKDKIVSGLKSFDLPTLTSVFFNCIRLYESFYLKETLALVEELKALNISFKKDPKGIMLEYPNTIPNVSDILIQKLSTLLNIAYADMDKTLEGVNIIPTEPVEWPHPTLMRYHLFLNEEEKLKEYDQIFYLDADMRVVAKIGDEIINEGLLAAEHPMYSLRKEYIPPYEPNPNSSAYIKRPGRVITEDGKPRFKPYYYAGGFQGGRSDLFIEAMKVMKESIDKDFNNNYVAIWNDESHWNKYLSDYEGELIVLDPSYVCPDSLIDDYYVKVWGKKYEPKIITITKPFSLSSGGGEEINKFIKQ